MGGGGDDVGVGYGGGVDAASYESGEVGHVHHEGGADLVGDGAHAGEVELARVGAASTYDYLGFFAFCECFELVVVNGFGVFADLVTDDSVELA